MIVEINNNIIYLTFSTENCLIHLTKFKYESIQTNDKTIIYNLNFEPENYDNFIFNKLLDISNANIDDIFNALDKCSKFFKSYEISRLSIDTIDKYINTLGCYNWNSITSKPDYNLSLYQSRTFPFNNVDSKEWKKSNTDSIDRAYPSALFQSVETIKDDKDFTYEVELARKNNNFLEYSILPVEKYPNMEKIVSRITIMHDVKLEKQALFMFLRLLLSPNECHIIREPAVWKIFKPIMAANYDYEELTKYCCFYAMYILRQEETIMFSQVNPKYRVLFTLEQANEIPTFDNSHIDRNIYMMQLPGVGSAAKCIPFFLQGKRKITSKKEFERRFRIVTGGIFEGLNLRELKAAITGSCIVSCAVTSPLEDNFKNLEINRSREGIILKYERMIDNLITQEDIDYYNFLEEYYPSYVSLPDNEFKKQVLTDPNVALAATPVKIADLYSDDAPSEEGFNAKIATLSMVNTINKNVTDEKPLLLPMDKTLIDKTLMDKTIMDKTPVDKMNPIPDSKYKHNPLQIDKSTIKIDYNSLADIDISITSLSQEEFKEKVYIIYNQIKKNAAHRGAVYIVEIKTIASIKYNLSGPGLPRPLDIFRIPYTPEKMIKKFHVNCVKMYYDGDLILFRSCIAALLSGVNENYKWFSCNKIPMDVILKYAQRG